MANSFIPQYVQIKSYLRSIIDRSEVDTMIPSENELAKTFSVSRGTAKQAIMDLVYEGILYRVQGKGTFVANRVKHGFKGPLPTLPQEIRNSGRVPTCTPLNFLKDAPAPRARVFFGLPDDIGILRYKRVISDNGEPVAVLKSFLNPLLYGPIPQESFSDFLYEILERTVGKVPVKAKDTYRFAAVSPSTAKLLHCTPGDPVCYSERIAYLEDGTPAEFMEGWIKASYFNLEVSYGLD